MLQRRGLETALEENGLFMVKFIKGYKNEASGRASMQTVLSERQVLSLKKYIHAKHPEQSELARSEILAKAVHQVIDRQLPGFPEGVKSELRVKLLRQVVGRRPLGTEDIFQACLGLDLARAELIEPFADWVGERLERAVDGRELREAAALAASGARPSLALLASPQAEAAAAAEAAAWPGIAPPGRIGLPARLRKALRAGTAIPLPAAIACCLALFGLLLFAHRPAAEHPAGMGLPAGLAELPPSYHRPPAMEAIDLPDSGLPAEFSYTAVNSVKLRQYLRGRSSILAEKPYFTAILETSQRYNVHPLLLFAIAGQEQGFVPSDAEQAERIANNPFNVYHSWKEYNTDIRDSATIAAKLLIKLNRDRPGDKHPIAWINQTYAEDPNWWKGVTAIFETLKQVTGIAEVHT